MISLIHFSNIFFITVLVIKVNWCRVVGVLIYWPADCDNDQHTPAGHNHYISELFWHLGSAHCTLAVTHQETFLGLQPPGGGWWCVAEQRGGSTVGAAAGEGCWQ